MEKFLGKINDVHFGHGGYQDAMIGITFSFEGKNIGVGDFWGFWSLERTDGAKWTEKDRIEYLGKMCLRINKLLEDAKVSNVDELKNIPVEVTTDGNVLKSWRILTEVL